MKRKDSNMEIFKEWGPPRSNVQLFVPQDCVAACYEVITNNSDWATNYTYRWIDLNGDGKYQRGDRFRVSDGGSTAPAYTPDGEWNSLNVYLRYSTSSGNPEYTTTPADGTFYNTANNFRGMKTFRNLKIIDDVLYYKNVDATS